MKNKVLLVITFIIFNMVYITKANAVTINDQTPLVSNPSMKLLTAVNSSVYNLKSKYNTITGAHSYVYFYDRTELPSSFASDSTRILEVSLFEQDSGNNDDDLVKIYTYHFRGRLMDGVEVKTVDSGNIDSSGDSQGEFYLRFFLHSTNSDVNYNAYTGSFFKYKIAVS